ncbi:hypothetical protein HBB16_11900 [Pseudonocardia sp. MCCB 268]|nr:hypothetical protein [Pseudonocardia cytotoxica]
MALSLALPGPATTPASVHGDHRHTGGDTATRRRCQLFDPPFVRSGRPDRPPRPVPSPGWDMGRMKSRVLVVDDDPALARCSPSCCGARVRDHGRLRRDRRCPPSGTRDVVLLDLMLPG